MIGLESHLKAPPPRGLAKIMAMNWPVLLLLCTLAGVGFVMLYSVAGGTLDTWAKPQMQRFAVGLIGMLVVAVIPIGFWRRLSFLAYAVALLLLIAVEFIGVEGKGAQRWIDLGFMRLQPSEVMKIALVMALAAYYNWLPLDSKSRPFWVLVPVVLIALPVFLVLRQPDLGTSILLVLGGGAVMFMAGVHWAHFATVIAGGVGVVIAVFQGRGTSWQFLKDYQYNRIDTFLDPSKDPLGTGYHITQAKIALGSGGWTGRGFMQGTQSRLNFLPEKHTDFIFTTLAEEFGFVGASSVLGLYVLVLLFCAVSALSNKDRYAALLTMGIGVTFFLFFAVNMGMVMGLLPVVGVPLPLISYGGSAMLILLLGFGLMQSAHIYRPRYIA